MSYMANFIGSFNVLFAPIAMLLLIVIDYCTGYVDDLFRRKMYMFAIIPTFLAIVCDMLYDVFTGMPGKTAYYAVYVSSFLYYVFQVTAFYSTNLFVDYQMNKDSKRTTKFGKIIGIAMVIHILILLLNIKFKFYFVIDENNIYHPGPMYIIRLVFSYLAAVFAFINVYISRRNVKSDQIGIIFFFIVLTGIGSTLDLILPGAKLVWPCFCSALLFSYFFIIRAESKTDVLTGVNNRRSCEEYIKNIAESSKKHSYNFIMIDLDGFKQINDKFGHVQGDEALKDAANLIRHSTRKNDFIARYGGDEFLVIAQMDNIELLVIRLQSEFARFNEDGYRPYKLFLSMGYDIYTSETKMTPQEFVAHVDSMMYRAKKENAERRQNAGV